MPFQITKAGIYLDVPTDDYFADPCPEPSLTQSIAKILIEKSPAHAAAEHPRLKLETEAEEETAEKYDAAKAIGNAAHAFLIGRGKTIAVGQFPNWQTKDAKAFKADAIAAGKTPILDKHMVRATRMVDAAREQILSVSIDHPGEGWEDAFLVGNGEVVIAWQEGGLWMRSLIDWMVTPARTYDFKSSGLSCAPHAIPSLMANAGWAVQAAFQERGLDVLDPDNAGRRKFRFIAMENEPPYALTAVELPEAAMTMGRKRVQYAVDAWRRSVETKGWPAYTTDICRPTEPGWKEAAWLARETEESERPRKTGNVYMAG